MVGAAGLGFCGADRESCPGVCQNRVILTARFRAGYAGGIGSGKSTSIAAALGKAMPGAGGFLTVRQRDDTGRAAACWLQRCGGSCRQCIIDYSAKPYTMHMEVFETFGVELLKQAKQYDYVVLNVILSKEPSYVGMLGGKPKIRALFKKLKENSYSEEALKQVHAPIGLDIGGERPAEIAVSIMAEIQTARYGGSCRCMSEILRDSVFPLE